MINSLSFIVYLQTNMLAKNGSLKRNLKRGKLSNIFDRESLRTEVVLAQVLTITPQKRHIVEKHPDVKGSVVPQKDSQSARLQSIRTFGSAHSLIRRTIGHVCINSTARQETRNSTFLPRCHLSVAAFYVTKRLRDLDASDVSFFFFSLFLLFLPFPWSFSGTRRF